MVPDDIASRLRDDINVGIDNSETAGGDVENGSSIVVPEVAAAVEA